MNPALQLCCIQGWASWLVLYCHFIPVLYRVALDSGRHYIESCTDGLHSFVQQCDLARIHALDWSQQAMQLFNLSPVASQHQANTLCHSAACQEG